MGSAEAFAVMALRLNFCDSPVSQWPSPQRHPACKPSLRGQMPGNPPCNRWYPSGPNVSGVGCWSWLPHQMADNENSVAGDVGTERPWHWHQVEIRAAGMMPGNAGLRYWNPEPGSRPPPGYGAGWRLLGATEALEEDKQSLRVVNHQLKAHLDDQRVSLAPCKSEAPLLQLGEGRRH